MTNISYRFTDKGVLFTDIDSKTYINVPYDIFNHINTELRDRNLDKKYSNKKIETGVMNKDQLIKTNNILKNLVENELIPDITYKINEALTKRNMSISMAIYENIVINLINQLTFKFVMVYPKPIRLIMTTKMLDKLVEGIIRLPKMMLDNNDAEHMSKEMEKEFEKRAEEYFNELIKNNEK